MSTLVHERQVGSQSNVHVDQISKTKRQDTQVKSDWTCLNIFDSVRQLLLVSINGIGQKARKIASLYLLLLSKICKTRYILYLGGRWSDFFMSTWTRGRQCTKCPRKSTIGRWVVKIGQKLIHVVCERPLIERHEEKQIPFFDGFLNAL